MAGQKPFYIGLAVIGVAGAVFLASRVMGGGTVSIPANVAVVAGDTAGFRGYVLGAETAPIEVVEYADFQCPVCADFDALTFQDLKTRLIDAGKIRTTLDTVLGPITATNLREAHRIIESNRARGKIVLEGFPG